MPPRKQATAVSIESGAIQLDGRLHEDVWRRIPAVTDFVQKNPVEGADPADKMEVKIAYDDVAVYVGARMYAKDPQLIQAPVGRRDNIGQMESIIVSLDTYLDRRTAFTFAVSASGVRADWYNPVDEEDEDDESFNPVWEARAAVDTLGWTAEMRIPFTQLRFNDRPSQVWGLNIARRVPTRNEEDYWVPIPRNEVGWASRFGDLTGIEGVKPTRRIELLPYVASDATVSANRDPANPFDDGRNIRSRVGGDVKLGLGPNLTLEGTVNPDFGQVEADPAEVNLSAFETFFDEQRPFFIEGSQLFEGQGPGYFYSRRIGAQPRGSATGDFVDYPTNSTILGAAKLTGRLSSGTSVAALGALTDREYARGFDIESGVTERVRVAPLVGYGVARLQQEFGRNASTAGIVVTGVHRDLASGDPLASILNRQAVTGGGDFTLRFMRGQYILGGYAGFSAIEGDTAAIRRVQTSSVHYFQRPDADHVSFDPLRTSLAGYTAALGGGRQSGRHWLWEGSAFAESPGFDLNDAGRLGGADSKGAEARLTYRETEPGKVFRAYEVELASENRWNFGDVKLFGALRTDIEAVWNNYWETAFTAWVDYRGQSHSLTRGGPLMGTGQAWVVIGRLSNNSSSTTHWRGRVYYGENELGEQTYRFSGGVSFRPGPRWQLSVDPNYLRAINPRQYITVRRGEGPSGTYGDRYVFSFIDRSTFLAQLRLSYAFTPDLTLETYAEPFAASGHYHGFGELPAARSRELRVYGVADSTSLRRNPDGTVTVTDRGQEFTLTGSTVDDSPSLDFNVLSFRSNVVLRWEWRPGSTLFLVWQQDRSQSEAARNLVGLDELGRSLAAAGDNFFAVKASFFIGLR